MEWIDFLQIMLKEEELAQLKYEIAASQVQDPDLKKTFEMLRYEESMHAALIQGKYDQLKEKLRRLKQQ